MIGIPQILLLTGLGLIIAVPIVIFITIIPKLIKRKSK